MRFGEYITYKTMFYLLHDESGLDFSLYKDVTKKEARFTRRRGFNADDFVSCYNRAVRTDEHIVVLRTNVGTFIFKRCDEGDDIKHFLEKNSHFSTAIYYCSHRVSGSYIWGVAKNGRVERFLSFTDEGRFIEGNPSIYEPEIMRNLYLDEDGRVECWLKDEEGDSLSFHKEESLYSCLSEYLGRAPEELEIEVLDFKEYEYTGVESKITNDTPYEIIDNLNKYNIRDIALTFTYHNKLNTCYLFCVHTKDGDCFIPSAEKIDDFRDCCEFKSACSRAFNCLAQKDLLEKDDIPYDFYLYSKEVQANENYNSVAFLVDTEIPGILTVALNMRNGKKIEAEKISKTMQDFNFNLNVFERMYEFCRLWVVSNKYDKLKAKEMKMLRKKLKKEDKLLVKRSGR